MAARQTDAVLPGNRDDAAAGHEPSALHRHPRWPCTASTGATSRKRSSSRFVSGRGVEDQCLSRPRGSRGQAGQARIGDDANQHGQPLGNAKEARQRPDLPLSHLWSARQLLGYLQLGPDRLRRLRRQIRAEENAVRAETVAPGLTKTACGASGVCEVSRGRDCCADRADVRQVADGRRSRRPICNMITLRSGYFHRPGAHLVRRAATTVEVGVYDQGVRRRRHSASWGRPVRYPTGVRRHGAAAI